MRVLFTTNAQFPIPAERIPAVIDGFAAWWERYRDRCEGAGFFAEGNGGCGIFDVADETEFHQMMLDWPLTPFNKNEARIDMDTALGQWQTLVATLQGNT